MTRSATIPTSRGSAVVPRPLDDLAAGMALIAEVTGTPIAEVSGRLRREHEWLARNVCDDLARHAVPPFVFSPAMEQFYAQTDAFVYETFTWNRYRLKQQMRRWILAFLERHYPHEARVLAFGDGLGFDSAGLALAGHRVTYFDVGQQSVAFAQKVFAANAVDVEVLTDPNELAPESFDVVLCLDVLEHVPRPCELVRQVVGYLRPGGHLLVHGPFWFLHPAVSTHLAANRRYSGEFRRLYADAGLRAVDGALVWNPIALEKADSGQARAARVPMSIQAKLYFGGLILKVARWWNQPLVQLTLALFALERRRLHL